MELVPASQFTLQQLTDAYNQTRVDYLVPMPMTTQRLQEYITRYDVDMDGSVVAVDEGEIIGLCMLGLRENRSWITRLGVLPTTRRRGIGLALMEHCLTESIRRGSVMAYLEVIVGNTPAHTLFLKLGFRETRKLLVLRRPPGPPPSEPIPPPAQLAWIDHEQVLALAAARPWRPAWTNQIESMGRFQGLQGLHITEQEGGASGWVSFQKSTLQLKDVIIGPDEGFAIAPAYNLLYHLHGTFPALDTIAENVPTHVPHLQDFWAHGYIQSFARVEMELPLNS